MVCVELLRWYLCHWTLILTLDTSFPMLRVITRSSYSLASLCSDTKVRSGMVSITGPLPILYVHAQAFRALHGYCLPPLASGGIVVKVLTCILIFCNSVDSSPARSLCPQNFTGKKTGVGCHFLLQGIFLTQGSNLCLLLGRWILLPLSHLGSPGYEHFQETSWLVCFYLFVVLGFFSPFLSVMCCSFIHE